MKQYRIFTITLLIVVLSLSVSAQKKEGYIFFPDRGYVYYFPIDNAPKIDNIKDTAKYQFNGLLVKEIKGKVYKNDIFLSEIMPGDTILITNSGAVQFFFRRKN